jgi:hypothetical protein
MVSIKNINVFLHRNLHILEPILVCWKIEEITQPFVVGPSSFVVTCYNIFQ